MEDFRTLQIDDIQIVVIGIGDGVAHEGDGGTTAGRDGLLPFHSALGVEEGEAFVVQAVIHKVVACGFDVEHIFGRGTTLVFLPEDGGVIHFGPVRHGVVDAVFELGTGVGVGRCLDCAMLGIEVAREQ